MERGEFLTHREVQVRGWTPRIFARFAQYPDRKVILSGSAVFLYRKTRIQEIESRPDFQSAMAAEAKARVRRLDAERKRWQRTRKEIRKMDFAVPVMPWTLLVAIACESYNDRQQERGLAWRAESSNSARFIERIVVNFLRHEMTPYEQKLARPAIESGPHQAYFELRKRIFRKIIEAYPVLSAECCRQHRASLEQLRESSRARCKAG